MAERSADLAVHDWIAGHVVEVGDRRSERVIRFVDGPAFGRETHHGIS